ncbi:MAG: MFS transporter [Saprospiraceae bacterium]|nr:MFS transporter [Saprospiraceae bacterium]
MKNQSSVVTLPKHTLSVLASEIAERFSFFGLAAILPIFLKNHCYDDSETEAASVLHLWRSGVFFFPLFGAIIADVFLGKYRTILIGSLLCCIGHAILSISIDNCVFFLVGIFLIAMSAGVIKSNVSPFLGDQIGEQFSTQRGLLFNYLYLSINLGGGIALLCVPYLRETYGNAIAFGVPGLAMFIALVVFVIPGKSYKKSKGVGVSEYKNLFSKKNLIGIKKSCTLFAFLIIYFMLFENYGGAWVYQAEKLDLNFWGYSFAPDQMQSSNPILIIILIPLFTGVLFPFLKKNYGIELSLFQKIKIGFFLLIIAFVIIIFIQVEIDKGRQPHAYWQLIAYFFLTASEVLVSVSCLQYAYEVAGPNVKSIVTALFMLSTAFGNVLLSWLNTQIHSGNLNFLGVVEMDTKYYLLLLVLMALNSLAFFYFFSHTNYQQNTPTANPATSDISP